MHTGMEQCEGAEDWKLRESDILHNDPMKWMSHRSHLFRWKRAGMLGDWSKWWKRAGMLGDLDQRLVRNKLENWCLNPTEFQSFSLMMPVIMENESLGLFQLARISNQPLKKGELLSMKLPYRVSILLKKEVNASNSKLQLLEFLRHPKKSPRVLPVRFLF